jgi:regulator of protease activity HflC (stomatin/prohibitin superfamily)
VADDQGLNSHERLHGFLPSIRRHVKMERLMALMFKVVVKDDERAFLSRDGRFERVLGPGRFTAFDPAGHLTAEIVKVVRAEIAADKALLFARTHPAVAAEHFEIVQAGPTEVAIVSFDGEPKHVVLPNTSRAFWKTLTRVDVERIDAGTEVRVAKRHIDKLDFARMPLVVHATVEAHEAGLLFLDGKLSERLPAGRHAFWAVGRTVRIQKLDTRPTALEVTAQEILTKDRVGIRVTLTAFTRVVDPEKAVLAAGDVSNTVYRLVQFAIREAVATRTLDEILAARDTIDREIRAFVTARAGDLGVEVGEIGVKDVILPGDVRELLNKVVEAERVAKANLIRRQEETAATRSLLNTARLMEDNPLLLRLKELEALERLVEKVGRIDLHTGGGAGGFDALLQNLYRLRGEADGAKPGDTKPAS